MTMMSPAPPAVRSRVRPPGKVTDSATCGAAITTIHATHATSSPIPAYSTARVCATDNTPTRFRCCDIGPPSLICWTAPTSRRMLRPVPDDHRAFVRDAHPDQRLRLERRGELRRLGAELLGALERPLEDLETNVSHRVALTVSGYRVICADSFTASQSAIAPSTSADIFPVLMRL